MEKYDEKTGYSAQHIQHDAHQPHGSVPNKSRDPENQSAKSQNRGFLSWLLGSPDKKPDKEPDKKPVSPSRGKEALSLEEQAENYRNSKTRLGQGWPMISAMGGRRVGH